MPLVSAGSPRGLWLIVMIFMVVICDCSVCFSPTRLIQRGLRGNEKCVFLMASGQASIGEGKNHLLSLFPADAECSLEMNHIFLLQKLQELQIKNTVVSNLGTLQDDESVDKQQWNKTQRELQGMKAKIEQQVGAANVNGWIRSLKLTWATSSVSEVVL